MEFHQLAGHPAQEPRRVGFQGPLIGVPRKMVAVHAAPGIHHLEGGSSPRADRPRGPKDGEGRPHHHGGSQEARKQGEARLIGGHPGIGGSEGDPHEERPNGEGAQQERKSEEEPASAEGFRVRIPGRIVPGPPPEGEALFKGRSPGALSGGGGTRGGSPRGRWSGDPDGARHEMGTLPEMQSPPGQYI